LKRLIPSQILKSFGLSKAYGKNGDEFEFAKNEEEYKEKHRTFAF
jgi:hypothetical protein